MCTEYPKCKRVNNISSRHATFDNFTKSQSFPFKGIRPCGYTEITYSALRSAKPRLYVFHLSLFLYLAGLLKEKMYLFYHGMQV